MSFYEVGNIELPITINLKYNPFSPIQVDPRKMVAESGLFRSHFIKMQGTTLDLSKEVVATTYIKDLLSLIHNQKPKLNLKIVAELLLAAAEWDCPNIEERLYRAASKTPQNELFDAFLSNIEKYKNKTKTPYILFRNYNRYFAENFSSFAQSNYILHIDSNQIVDIIHHPYFARPCCEIYDKVLLGLIMSDPKYKYLINQINPKNSSLQVLKRLITILKADNSLDMYQDLYRVYKSRKEELNQSKTNIQIILNRIQEANKQRNAENQTDSQEKIKDLLDERNKLQSQLQKL